MPVGGVTSVFGGAKLCPFPSPLYTAGWCPPATSSLQTDKVLQGGGKLHAAGPMGSAVLNRVNLGIVSTYPVQGANVAGRANTLPEMTPGAVSQDAERQERPARQRASALFAREGLYFSILKTRSENEAGIASSLAAGCEAQQERPRNRLFGYLQVTRGWTRRFPHNSKGTTVMVLVLPCGNEYLRNT